MAITLTAEPRSELGKEKCKKLRAAGRLPANVYGGPFGTSPRALTLDLHSTELAVKRNGKSAQYELAFEGDVHQVRIQQVGYEPVYKRFEHLDLFVRSAAEAREDQRRAEQAKAEAEHAEQLRHEKEQAQREKAQAAEQAETAAAPAPAAEGEAPAATTKE